MAVSDIDAIEILDLLTEVGADPRVTGGWGVDALAECSTRVHRDLDLAVRAETVHACVDALAAQGYRVTTDWLPVRVELDDGVRFVDLHPLHDAADGGSWQAGLDGTRLHYPADAWTSGLIAGRSLTCLSHAMQRRFHSGYEQREVDRHDLALLEEMEAD